jgi:hypothetical protein
MVRSVMSRPRLTSDICTGALETSDGVRGLDVRSSLRYRAAQLHDTAAVTTVANHLVGRVARTCAFFVAFSRAKMRVVLTFCNQRTTGQYHQNRAQAAKGIRPLYDILRAAGLRMRRIAPLLTN